jgi:ferredoxin--NADP+ reductase
VAAPASNNQVKTMVGTLTNWLVEEQDTGASRRLHLHFLQQPVEVLGEDGAVTGLRMERMELDGTGNVKGTGEYTDYPVQAVYRAIGYHGSPVPGLAFDERRGVIPNDAGRVLDGNGTPVPGVYTSGWIKRGPVGLIGHTKGDALETIGCLLEDQSELWTAEVPDEQSILDLLTERGVRYTTWEGWLKLDAHELSLGAAATESGPVERERVKVVAREEMVDISRAQ